MRSCRAYVTTKPYTFAVCREFYDYRERLHRVLDRLKKKKRKKSCNIPRNILYVWFRFVGDQMYADSCAQWKTMKVFGENNSTRVLLFARWLVIITQRRKMPFSGSNVYWVVAKASFVL